MKKSTKKKTARERAVTWLASAPPGVVTLHYCHCKDEFLTVVTMPARERRR